MFLLNVSEILTVTIVILFFKFQNGNFLVMEWSCAGDARAIPYLIEFVVGRDFDEENLRFGCEKAILVFEKTHFGTQISEQTPGLQFPHFSL